MIQLKVRAWDKKDKKMRIVTRITFGLEPTGHPPIIVHLDDGKEPITRSINDVDLLQYTGRKDRDNREIYKGDIVKNHWYDANGKFIGGLWVVKYGMHSIEGQDYYSNSGEGFYFDAQSGIDDDTYNIANLPADDDKGGIEIVGNVFENPELIKRK